MSANQELDAALDDRLLHRMLFFTDAVFAIVLTLLVLELKAPEHAVDAVGAELREAVPHIVAFILSFAIIGTFWAAHLNSTRKLVRFDWPVAVANLAFLLPICLLPYATAWLGADINGAYSWSLYCWTLIATSFTNMVLVALAHRGGGRLIGGATSPREAAYRIFRSLTPGIAFAVGLILLQLDQLSLAHFCWVLIPIGFQIERWALGPKRGKGKATAKAA